MHSRSVIAVSSLSPKSVVPYGEAYLSWFSDSLQPNRAVASANRSTQMGRINSLD